MVSGSFQPLLAGKASNLDALNYPVIVSPKLDGIRCVVTPEGAMTRKLKRIPNKKLFDLLSKPEFVGLDGELIAGPPSAPDAMQRTSSAVMSHDGDINDVRFYVFDNFAAPSAPYITRLQSMVGHAPPSIPECESLQQVWRHGASLVVTVPMYLADSRQKVEEYEEEFVSQGYEGLMIRSPNGRYKFGRSTEKEQILLKLKRFEDDEAVVVGFEEQMHNANEKERDERGYAKRSTAQAGKVPMGALGALISRSDKWPNEFNVGNGWTADQRKELWEVRDTLIGRTFTFKHQPHGAKDAPRLPVFKAWRLD